MTDPAAALPAVRAAAETALAAAWGGPVRLAPGMAFDNRGRRAAVYRCPVRAAPPGAPASVIVKQAPGAVGETYDPAATQGPAGRLFNEWAALALLTEVAADLALTPRFYAGDRIAGLVVMEDLGTGVGLDQRLLGPDPTPAEAGLLALATRLGHLHARTSGQEARYQALRDALGPRPRWRMPPCGAPRWRTGCATGWPSRVCPRRPGWMPIWPRWARRWPRRGRFLP